MNDIIKKLDEKQLIKGIGAVILHLVLSIAYQIPFIFLIDKTKFPSSLALLLVNILLLITFISIYRKRLITDFKDLKKNYKKIIKTTIKYWLIGFALMIVFGMMINSLPIKPNTNQEANIELLKNIPIIEVTLAVILSPIIEEIAYRLSFRKFTNNKWLFAITTGLIFAGVHIISSISSKSDLIMLIYLLPYGALGICFGLSYFKTDNIYGTMLIHALHNTISILELLIIGGIII